MRETESKLPCAGGFPPILGIMKIASDCIDFPTRLLASWRWLVFVSVSSIAFGESRVRWSAERGSFSLWSASLRYHEREPVLCEKNAESIWESARNGPVQWHELCAFKEEAIWFRVHQTGCGYAVPLHPRATPCLRVFRPLQGRESDAKSFPDGASP